MSAVEIIAIFLAGVGAGTINAVVGSGTLITFPTLVAFGYPPVVATMSNAIGLVAGGVSGTWGYRVELSGQWDRLRWQIPASFAGALVGAWLLLHLPESTFKKVVPVLLIIALVLVVIQPRLQASIRRRAEAAGRDHDVMTRGRFVVLIIATFLVGMMGVLLPESMQRMNAAKNLLTLVVNAVAATTYVIVGFDRIAWGAAALIAVGSLIGGFLGAHYGRRLSPVALRGCIVVFGLIALWRLLVA